MGWDSRTSMADAHRAAAARLVLAARQLAACSEEILSTQTKVNKAALADIAEACDLLTGLPYLPVKKDDAKLVEP
jgi:hypothetical protein